MDGCRKGKYLTCLQPPSFWYIFQYRRQSLTYIQLGVLFQIIEKSGPIPWDDLKLPDGRTKKAVQVMVDKEKQKLKKARDAENGGESGKASPKVYFSRNRLLESDSNVLTVTLLTEAHNGRR